MRKIIIAVALSGAAGVAYAGAAVMQLGDAAGAKASDTAVQAAPPPAVDAKPSGGRDHGEADISVHVPEGAPADTGERSLNTDMGFYYGGIEPSPAALEAARRAKGGQDKLFEPCEIQTDCKANEGCDTDGRCAYNSYVRPGGNRCITDRQCHKGNTCEGGHCKGLWK